MFLDSPIVLKTSSVYFIEPLREDEQIKSKPNTSKSPAIQNLT